MLVKFKMKPFWPMTVYPTRDVSWVSHSFKMPQILPKLFLLHATDDNRIKRIKDFKKKVFIIKRFIGFDTNIMMVLKKLLYYCFRF